MEVEVHQKQVYDIFTTIKNVVYLKSIFVSSPVE